MPVSEAHMDKYEELFTSDQPIIITPFKPDLLVDRRPCRAMATDAGAAPISRAAAAT